MKQCPNCNRIYMDYDQYCLVCRYKLKYIEGSEKIEYCPEPYDTSYIKPTSPKPEISCPYCHSNDTKKISITGRIVSTGLFGLASKKIGKQWHCNQCGSDF